MHRVISRTKGYFSNVRKSAWHYKLVDDIFDGRVGGKACTYYWVKLPITLLAVGALAVLYAIVITVFWLSGRVPVNFDDPTYLTPYKTTRSGKKVRFAPWEILTLVALAFALYFFVWVNQTAGVITTAVLVGLMTGGFLFIFLVRNEATRGLRAELKSAWDRVCPNLTIVEVSEKKGSES